MPRAIVCMMTRKRGFQFAGMSSSNESDFDWKQEVLVSCSANEAMDERGASVDKAPVNEAPREGVRMRKPPTRYGYDLLT